MKTRIKVTRVNTGENGEAIIDAEHADIIAAKAVMTSGGVIAVYVVEAIPYILTAVENDSQPPPEPTEIA